MKPMKTNPSMRDLLMQLQLHMKVLKGRNRSAFSQQPRAATAICQGEAGSISQTPPSSTSSDPRDSRSLHAIHLTSTLIFQKPLAAGLCFQTPLGDRLSQLRVPPPPCCTSGAHQIFSAEVESRERLGVMDLALLLLSESKMLNLR